MIKILEQVDNCLSTLTMTLPVEWDILSALYNALKWFLITLNFEHVHSHQDEAPTTRKLYVPVQLNIDQNEISFQHLKC